MHHLKLFMLSIVFTVFTVSISKADEGCAVSPNTSSEVVYTQRSGSVGTRRNFIGPTSSNDIGFPTACPRYSYSAAYTTTERCAINGVYDASYRILIFTPLNCPIDGYTSLLIFLVGCLGFFSLNQTKYIKLKFINL